MLGVCRLCHSEADLQLSHIVPRWAWKRAHGSSPGHNPTPVVVSGGVAMQHPKQLSEHMLCKACEHRLKGAEDYAAEVTYQRDTAAPFLDRVGDVVQEANGIRVAEPGTLRPDVLAYFGVSVIWRASLSDQIDNCSLGERHEEALRQYLLGAAAFPPDAACAVVFHDLPYDGNQVASFFLTPYTDASDIGTESRFFIYGLSYFLVLGDRAEPWSVLCSIRSPQRLVGLAPQEWLLDWFGETAKNARVVGTLKKLSRH